MSLKEQLINRAPADIISTIAPPSGWEIVEDPDDTRMASVNLQEKLKVTIAADLPHIAHNVELYMDRADKQYDINISEAYISIDDDATYHIELLINKEDFRTPEFFKAKMQAADMLATTDDVSMRHTFTVASEYFRFHSTLSPYKLKYSYKSPISEQPKAVNTDLLRY